MKTEKTNGKRSLRYLRSPGDGARARLGERQGSEHGALRPALQRNGTPVGAQRLAEGIPIDDISWAGIVAAAATVGVRAEG